MLIYLSSYPRSGNTWVRHLIRHYFGYRSASIYPEPQGAPNLEYQVDGSYELFSYYELPQQPGSRLPMLVNNCSSILSPALREQLGQSEERFFLKTHELPFDRYFEGEYVLHLMREPGAVCWSYYNFLQKNRPAIANVILTLDGVIKGRVPFGSWSDHARAWLQARNKLGERFLMHKYEDLSAQPETEFCDLLASFTGLTYRIPKTPLPSLEHWHKQAPNLYRKQKVSNWKSHFSAMQLHRILKRHGEMMQQLGYDTDEYQTSLRDRLLSLIPFSSRVQQPQPPTT
jgi:hypothetical protein